VGYKLWCSFRSAFHGVCPVAGQHPVLTRQSSLEFDALELPSMRYIRSVKVY
jgi:hypothetical protein